MSSNRDSTVILAKEMKRTEDGIRGTMGWIECRVSADVYEKMKTVIKQSIRYGIMKNVLEGQAFQNGIEEEISDA